MKIPKQAYTAEFKELAVKRVKDGQSVGIGHIYITFGTHTHLKSLQAIGHNHH